MCTRTHELFAVMHRMIGISAHKPLLYGILLLLLLLHLINLCFYESQICDSSIPIGSMESAPHHPNLMDTYIYTHITLCLYSFYYLIITSLTLLSVYLHSDLYLNVRSYQSLLGVVCA